MSASQGTSPVSVSDAQIDENWPRSVQMDLEVHMRDTQRLFLKAHPQRREHAWYHTYNNVLTFNAIRMSDETNRFSVYPQTELRWASKPDSKLNDSSDTGGNKDFEGSDVVQAGNSGEGEQDSSEKDEDDEGEDDDRDDEDYEYESDEGDEDSEGEEKVTMAELAALTISDKQKPDNSAGRASEPNADEGLSIAKRKTPRDAVHRDLQNPLLVLPSKARNSRDKTRYPDFSVISTILKAPDSANGIYSMHSLWELKAPRDLALVQGYSDDIQKQSIVKTLLKAEFTIQILRQASGAFSEYKHQRYMHIFLVAGYWAYKTKVERAKMPSQEFLDRSPGPHMLELKQYVSWGTPFRIYCDGDGDYTSAFKSHWMEAAEDVLSAAASVADEAE